MAEAPNGAFMPSQDGLRRMVEAMEGQTAAAMEQLVAGDGFSELLVRCTENAVALSRVWVDVWDLAVRNMRLAGRSDIDRLARQLMRTEDKLELVLQAVERLEPAAERG